MGETRDVLDELTDEQRARLAMMQELRRGWANWQTARYIVIGSALQLIDGDRLAVTEVCAALECSPATWYRWVAELRARLAGLGSAAVEATADQAEAGAADALAVLKGESK